MIQAALERASSNFRGAEPFDHMVIDDFFLPDIADQLECEVPAFDSACWYVYDNEIEIKKACNNWNRFPRTTYNVFNHLNSADFIERLSTLLGIPNLSPDPGLNGGGWHVHASGGKLNPHLDYNIHPKLGLQRKLNVIVYLNCAWRPEWGGQLGLWRDAGGRPSELIRLIEPLFNRAVVFDPTQNSWHGLARPLACPEGQTRKSIAVSYLAPPPAQTERREKALFVPAAGQHKDWRVLDLIERRARGNLDEAVYRSKLDARFR